MAQVTRERVAGLGFMLVVTVSAGGVVARSPTWERADGPASECRSDTARGAVCHVLVRGEHGATDFVVRYFMVLAGAQMPLDSHPHERGVVVVRGAGRVLLGGDWHEIREGNSASIAGAEAHRLRLRRIARLASSA